MTQCLLTLCVLLTSSCNAQLNVISPLSVHFQLVFNGLKSLFISSNLIKLQIIKRMYLINVKIITLVLIAFVLFGPMINNGYCDEKSVQNNGLPQERGNISDLGPPVDVPDHEPTANELDETIVNGKGTNKTSTNRTITKGKLTNEKPKSKSKDFYDKVPDLVAYYSKVEKEILSSGTRVNKPNPSFIISIYLINLLAFNLVI